MKKILLFSLLLSISCNDKKNSEEELVQELFNVAKKHNINLTFSRKGDTIKNMKFKTIREFDSFLTVNEQIIYSKGYADTFYTLDEKDLAVEKSKKQ